jgi:hypothetical protein
MVNVTDDDVRLVVYLRTTSTEIKERRAGARRGSRRAGRLSLTSPWGKLLV